MTAKQGDWEKVYCSSGQVVTRNIAGETILVPVSGNLANMQRIFTINEVGAAIWSRMNGEKSVHEIFRELMTEFDVAEDLLEVDLKEFIEKLTHASLIQES